jgi:DnaJ-class molecular chaperone
MSESKVDYLENGCSRCKGTGSVVIPQLARVRPGETMPVSAGVCPECGGTGRLKPK